MSADLGLQEATRVGVILAFAMSYINVNLGNTSTSKDV